MEMRWMLGLVNVALVMGATGACEEKKEAPKSTTAAALSAIPSAAAPEKSAEPAPQGCLAKGDKPIQIGYVLGDAYGFAGDTGYLYISSWQVYGGRGDVTKVRKDGQGTQALSGLKLEPRGLVLDTETVYFTAGIRLNSVPKQGGDTQTLHEQFSSQRIAVDEKSVFGVPGDYGPYDRLAKVSKKGGDSTEIATAKRPAVKSGANGYNAIALDASGVYVADSGNGKILKFPFEAGKPQVLASGLKQPLDLAINSANIYFTLASGDLMTVPKTGGKSAKVAAGLAEHAKVAADDVAIYTTQAAGDAANIVRVSAGDGALKAVAQVPTSHLVSAITSDRDCVYWVERQDATKSVVFALAK